MFPVIDIMLTKIPKPYRESYSCEICGESIHKTGIGFPESWPEVLAFTIGNHNAKTFLEAKKTGIPAHGWQDNLSHEIWHPYEKGLAYQ